MFVKQLVNHRQRGHRVEQRGWRSAKSPAGEGRGRSAHPKPHLKTNPNSWKAGKTRRGSSWGAVPGWHTRPLDHFNTWDCFTKRSLSCEIGKKFSASWCCLTFYLRDGALSSCSKFPHWNSPKKPENWHSQKVKSHILNTDAANPHTNSKSSIHLVPKKPGMVIWSWKVVMQSLHNMERFMEWLTCYRRTQTLSWCWQGMQRKHLSTHLTSALSCLKLSMDLSALLDRGLYAGQPW